ncbi:outer dense fiber protein 2 [Lasius niger]|uniref:Outer dense fiber protein 2 n=1 Tax=Lasius niger TaxID=67767 RepID=A0A0J7KXQ5_LASNI|nr:outer dense fiber protein 2 [Lasius niger]
MYLRRNMAENEIVDSEISEEQPEKETESVTVIDKAPTTTIDLAVDRINTEKKNENEDKYKENEDEDKGKVEGDKIDDKDKDEDKINERIEDESDLREKPLSYSIPSDMAKDDKIADEIIKFDEFAEPIISSPLLTDDIITELKEMNERCIILADEIQTLKREVLELSDKPELTEEDALVIQEKQDILMSKVAELEQLTQKVQKAREEVERIEDSSGEIEKVVEEEEEEVEKEKIDVESLKRIPEEDRFELPQIEYPEDKLPRIIVCGYTEDVLPKIVIADGERKGREKCFEKLTGKLTESLTMQEKLVKENAKLEGGKYKLEEALLEKDTALESLQRKVCALQAEMRIIVKENTELSRQLATLNQLVIRPTCCYTCPGVASSPPSTPPSLPLRPHVNSPRLAGGGSRTEDRYFVDNNPLQNVMCSRGPAVVRSSLPRGTCPAELEDKLATYGTSTKQLEQQLGSMETEVTATGSCTNAAMGTSVCAQQQLRDLREQYARLQDDYKNKLCEVSCMRTEAEKFKQDMRDAKEEKERMEIKLIDAQERLKLLETEKGKFEGHKEQLIEQEQALIVAKQRFREAQDELEELRSLIQDQAAQLEDYRNKYLQAQQQVEEQRRQLDLMEMDNARMNENVTLEIGRVKDESGKFEEVEGKCSELRHENERMKNTLTRFEEHEAQLQKRIDEKMHENTQLSSMLEQIREDSARQVARTKERCETMRRSMQGQIAEMERQLAQCRATARAAQRDRDEIRQKMQSQINNLNEAFKHAQGRIKSLQGHVNYLKTSYSNIFLGQGETPISALPGEDSCDCNY